MSILLIIAAISMFLFIVLYFLGLSPDFLLWVARKDNPEWAKEFDKHEKDFLRLKSGGSIKWGDC